MAGGENYATLWLVTNISWETDVDVCVDSRTVIRLVLYGPGRSTGKGYFCSLTCMNEPKSCHSSALMKL